jgi:Na+-translocating ferredoxin:NAD+ oxidoreductase RnfG subunit
VCENKLTIPQRRLEQQLIGAISTQLLDPRLEKERAQEFMKQLNAILEQEAKLARDAASKSSELKEQRAATMKEADNLIAASAKETPDGNVFEVSGDVALFVGEKEDAMVTNSLERIGQHYILPPIPLNGMLLNLRLGIKNPGIDHTKS